MRQCVYEAFEADVIHPIEDFHPKRRSWRCWFGDGAFDVGGSIEHRRLAKRRPSWPACLRPTLRRAGWPLPISRRRLYLPISRCVDAMAVSPPASRRAGRHQCRCGLTRLRAGPHHLTPHGARVLAQRDEGGFGLAVRREESQDMSSLVRVGTVGEAGKAARQSLQTLRRLLSPRRHLEWLEIVRGDTGVVKDALGGTAGTHARAVQEMVDGRPRDAAGSGSTDRAPGLRAAAIGSRSVGQRPAQGAWTRGAAAWPAGPRIPHSEHARGKTEFGVPRVGS